MNLVFKTLLIYVNLYDFMCTTCTQVLAEARERWVPWRWSYRHCEPPDVYALNHLVISPALPTKTFALSELLILPGESQGKGVGGTWVPIKVWKVGSREHRNNMVLCRFPSLNRAFSDGCLFLRVIPVSKGWCWSACEEGQR